MLRDLGDFGTCWVAIDMQQSWVSHNFNTYDTAPMQRVDFWNILTISSQIFPLKMTS